MSKIVSGILITRGHLEGSAVIDLRSNLLADDVNRHLTSSDLHQETIVAPADKRNAKYSGTPCAIVAMREFKLQVADEVTGDFSRDTYDFNVDSNVNDEKLTVSWRAPTRQGAQSRVEEISYLVIGEPE